jgi:RNA polymerase sigma-70 factor (ECF subfamily)
MSDSSLHTTLLHLWLDRMRKGDSAAPDELLRATCSRLERLARKMLRGFPTVARYEQTADVLQRAVLRLLRALEQVRPASVREFFGLAATQMRRELLDLARRYQGAHGPAANQATLPGRLAGDSDAPAAFDPPDPGNLDENLDRWCAFHEQVEALPAEEREVVSLVFYHGWTQAQIAELFGVTERTIRRYWQSACLKLSAALGASLPES